MYSLAPEKTLRLVYGPFYLAISVTFYEFIKLEQLIKKSVKNQVFALYLKSAIDNYGAKIRNTDGNFSFRSN